MINIQIFKKKKKRAKQSCEISSNNIIKKKLSVNIMHSIIYKTLAECCTFISTFVDFCGKRF